MKLTKKKLRKMIKEEMKKSKLDEGLSRTDYEELVLVFRPLFSKASPYAVGESVADAISWLVDNGELTPHFIEDFKEAIRVEL